MTRFPNLARLLFATLLYFSNAQAQSPTVTIIIDDIGYSPKALKSLLQLPYDLTFAILPEAPYAQNALSQLKLKGKEIILHLPMQGSTQRAQEKTVLSTHMSKETFLSTLRRELDILDGIAGVNNHQGSRLTKSAKQMMWLMAELRTIDRLYFLDSRTSGQSVAFETAQAFDVPAKKRDIFLDHERSDVFINSQFNALIKLAKKRGTAIGIGHPYPETIRVLSNRLPELAKQGIRVVRASSIIYSDSALK